MGQGSNDGYFETNGGQNNQQTDFNQQQNGFNQQQNGFNQQQYQGFNQFDPLMMSQFNNQYIFWLILGILQSLTLCCCNYAGIVTGLATIILLIAGKLQVNKGNINKGVKMLKIAKIINLLGWVILIVTIIVNFISGTYKFVSSLWK